ncbi:hypothetical protein AWB74_07436 [Caballeronia arvi]|uniref:Uncharacterized protein n=2 Tax=Caballeronia arvi TaxID=1777135 RepID=A0A158KYW0_9BURK|nr:hypothetical protein AWB74_07436 [Caballeronia arvi]
MVGAVVKYFVILVGSHWCDISPDVFKPHCTPGFSTVTCDTFDASGALVEIRRDDLRLFFPHTSVLLIVNVIDSKAGSAFGLLDGGDG